MLNVCFEVPLGTSLLQTSSSLSVNLVECYDKGKGKTPKPWSQQTEHTLGLIASSCSGNDLAVIPPTRTRTRKSGVQSLNNC